MVFEYAVFFWPLSTLSRALEYLNSSHCCPAALTLGPGLLHVVIDLHFLEDRVPFVVIAASGI